MTRQEREYIGDVTQRLWDEVWLLLDSEPHMDTDTSGKAAQAAVDVVRVALETKYAS